MRTDFDLNIQYGALTTPSQMASLPNFSTFEDGIELKPLQFSLVPVSGVNTQVTHGFNVANNILNRDLQISMPCIVHPNRPRNFFEGEVLRNQAMPIEMPGNVLMGYQGLLGVNQSPPSIMKGNGLNLAQGFGVGIHTHQQDHGIGDVIMGTAHKSTTHTSLAQRLLDRKNKRKMRNRESAARSRAQKMAYFIQQELEVDKLKHENEHLKRVLKILTSARRKVEENQAKMLRSSSMPPQV